MTHKILSATTFEWTKATYLLIRRRNGVARNTKEGTLNDGASVAAKGMENVIKRNAGWGDYGHHGQRIT